MGEGWHNYHHVFPWDYKTSELGTYYLNWTCALIDFFAKIGELQLKMGENGRVVRFVLCNLIPFRLGI